MKERLYRIVLRKNDETFTYEYYSCHRAYSKANFRDFIKEYFLKYGYYERYNQKNVICNYIV